MKLLWSAAAFVVGVALIAPGVAGLRAAGDGTRSDRVRVGGVPVEVVRPAGDGERRPAVVVVHGYAGSGRLMRPFADTLVRRGYVVALPDLAGHAANTRPLTGGPAIDREVASVVGHLRGRPDVDPARVALLGHSMGAAAVVRAGSADQGIPATVAVSLGDEEAAAVRPGPRGLLLVAGALEPGGIRTTTREAGRVEGRRVVTVPMVEHVGVLFAERTHDEAARWLDAALGHRPERAGVAAADRVGAGALVLVGALLVLAAAVTAVGRRGRRTDRPSGVGPDRLVWLGGAVVAAPVVGIVAGLVLSRVLPAPVSGYLVGYLGGAGAVLLVAELVRRRRVQGSGSIGGPRSWAVGAGLAVAAAVAVVVPVHAGLTAMVPHGGHRSMVALLALATAAAIAGALTTGRPLWTILVLVAVCLPLPVAAAVGLAPGFLVLIGPLVAVLFVVYFAVVGLAWRAGVPLWQTTAAGALVVAWPVATALPLG
jgi:alpha-beta hydrolase superfamily lysophospholipase